MYKIELPVGVQVILSMLHGAGYSAYVVGGCVRDSIMKIKPHDWDICTSATPEQMFEVFRDYRVIPTGVKHGTVTVVMCGVGYECTTYRVDGVYTDNRRPDNVIFTQNLVKDLERRDFTINAIAYNETEGLIDPFNGVQDIRNKIIRCVGNPTERFKEDTLRILRALRFKARLGFVIERNTEMSLLCLVNSLHNISIERIHDEICKIVKSKYAALVLEQYANVFMVCIPEMRVMYGFEQNNPYHDYTVWDHTIKTLYKCKTNDLITRLALLFHDMGKPYCCQVGEDGCKHFKGHGKVSASMADGVMQRLRFDNVTREKVVQLVYYHDATFEVGKKYVKRWLNKMGEEQFRRLLEVRKSDIKGQKAVYDKYQVTKVKEIEKLLNEVLAEAQCFTLKDLAVNGNDLLQAGFAPGRRLGLTLNALLDAVINEEVSNEKIALLEFAKRCVLNE